MLFKIISQLFLGNYQIIFEFSFICDILLQQRFSCFNKILNLLCNIVKTDLSGNDDYFKLIQKTEICMLSNNDLKNLISIPMINDLIYHYDF